MDYKVEGSITFPDHTDLTWGPFYYHSKESAIRRMDDIMDDIVSWCNLKDPSLDIKPQNVTRTRDEQVIGFNIQAWKNDTTLQECDGFIGVESIYFED